MEDGKAYIRGEVIKYPSSKIILYKGQVQILEKTIKTLELELHKNSNEDKHKQLTIMRAEHNKLTAETVAKNLLWIKKTWKQAFIEEDLY